MRARSRCLGDRIFLSLRVHNITRHTFFFFVVADISLNPYPAAPRLCKVVIDSQRGQGCGCGYLLDPLFVSATWCNVSYAIGAMQHVCSKIVKNRHWCSLWFTPSGRRPARYYRAWSLYSWRGRDPVARAACGRVLSAHKDKGVRGPHKRRVRLKHPERLSSRDLYD